MKANRPLPVWFGFRCQIAIAHPTKFLRIACFAAVSAVLLQSVSGQGFVNLNFESANLPTIPAGQLGDFVSSTDAIPGWTAYLGTNQLTQVLHNSGTLGNASVDIWGPDWTLSNVFDPRISIIQGNYTVVLTQGVDPFRSGQLVSASISQTGLVPGNAQSLQFKAVIDPRFFSVSLGGQDLSLITLGTGTNYTLYGANISQFAGQVEPLTFMVAPIPVTEYTTIDSIVFSPVSVPEPSVLSLLSICILFLCQQMKRQDR